MQPIQLHGDTFLRILWDQKTRIIGIDRKGTSSAMTDEDFMAELTLFAGYVERKKALRILVDVSKFRHKMTPDAQKWRVKNISSRYNAAGVKRFAFLIPKESQLPPMPESSDGEASLTRSFNSYDEAAAWLRAGEQVCP